MLRFQTPIACGLSLAALTPSIASAGAAGHLYAEAFEYASTASVAIYRFPLKNGIPTTKPNLTITGYGGGIAVSGNGTLYVSGGSPHNQIFAFPSGSTKPQRSITIPAMLNCFSSLPAVPGPIAADVHGNLFVALNSFDSLNRSVPAARRRVVGDWRLCYGVAIFGPKQHGGERPEHEVIFSSNQYVAAVGVDDAENMYASMFPSSLVQEYSNALRNPVPTQVFPWQPSTVFVGGLATDSGGDVYMLNQWNEVRVFPPSGMQLRNDMTFEAPHDGATSIAATSQYVYVANDHFIKMGAESVDIYKAGASGAQKPVFSLPVPGLVAVAIGP
jgi:hypothetical protein